jgi:hypothetical protein
MLLVCSTCNLLAQQLLLDNALQTFAGPCPLHSKSLGILLLLLPLLSCIPMHLPLQD